MNLVKLTVPLLPQMTIKTYLIGMKLDFDFSNKIVRLEKLKKTVEKICKEAYIHIIYTS